jgi:Tfp pilus assembly protein PilE
VIEIKNEKLKMKNFGKGFSILEVISAVFIFSIVTIAVYGSFSSGLKSIAQSKHRVAATELANEKMEIVRNMNYDDVGTQGGIPSGVLPQNETAWRSNQKFNVHTFIRYVDDSQDGIGQEDANQVTTDYKEVKVEITWPAVKTGQGVKLVSKFVPNGAESDVGGGTFRLNVLDGSGAGISGVETDVVNNDSDPQVNINTLTDSYGSVLLSGMPPGDRNYEISVSKSGYESVTTLPPYPETPFEPADTHASVIEGQLNAKAIIIDKLASLHIFSKNIQDEAFADADFNLAGGRVIGKEAGSGNDVTNYDENHSTGVTGDVSVENLSPGKYTITLNEPGYTLIGSDVSFPLALEPDQSQDVNLIVASNTENSLIVTVKDSETALAVSGASVRVWNGIDFDSTLITGQMGQVYFPPNTDPPTVLNPGDYNLEVTADGYETYSDSVAVSQLTQEQVNLIPVP